MTTLEYRCRGGPYASRLRRLVHRPVSWLGGLDSPAAASTPDLNLAISFDGMSLVHDGNATATTTPGEYDFAIA
jgi:hypothetical protein